MLFNFANVLIFLIVGVGFVFASLFLSRMLAPKVPFREKLLTYECGELPTEGGRINFNIRFYILALVFVIFDVELALMFPVGAVFKGWVGEGQGVRALIEIGLFVLILLLGLVYVWTKGDLQWVKKVIKEERELGTEIVPKASYMP